MVETDLDSNGAITTFTVNPGAVPGTSEVTIATETGDEKRPATGGVCAGGGRNAFLNWGDEKHRSRNRFFESGSVRQLMLITVSA
jgi:hypothetical protein